MRTGALPALAAGLIALPLAAPVGAQTASDTAPKGGKAARPSPKFAILEYRVEGNSKLPTIEVERAVIDHLGENRSVEDVEAARAELEKAYHDRGFKTVIVGIPEQQVTAGIITLRVTEASVEHLLVSGSRYHSLGRIREQVPDLQPGAVPDFKSVQRQLGDVNRGADLKVTPVLKAADTPGHVDVDLQVKDELPLHAILGVSNRYSANTSHTRLVGELRYDNLFQRNESLSLQYQIAPDHPADAKIGSLSYVLPFRRDLILALYAVHSDSDVAAVGDLNVIGKGDIFGVRLIDSLPSARPTFYHSFTAGLDYKRFKQTVVLQGAAQQIDSPVDYPPLTLDYSATWLGGAPDVSKYGAPATSTGRSSTTVDLDLNFLIRGLGTDWRQFANKRANAGPSYLLFRPSIVREQVLPLNLTLVAKVDGQLASGPLINNEQFSAGGAESVRGYTESERLGDDGIHGTLELRTAELLRPVFPSLQQSYVYLFADAARLHVEQPLPSQTATFSLASAGLGLRLSGGGLSAALDGARILTDGSVVREGQYRGLFNFTYTY